jgi:hypothetical protein
LEQQRSLKRRFDVAEEGDMGIGFTVSVPLTVYLYIELLGAGVLAAWFLAVCPEKGPKTLTGAIGPVLIALAIGELAPLVILALRDMPDSTFVVLIGFVLPLFCSFFVTTGWLLRALLSAVGGRSGGGGGHTVGA